MNGIVSFHPVDVAFFDTLIVPLLAGRKIDPDPLLTRAYPMRRYAWEVHRYASARGWYR